MIPVTGERGYVLTLRGCPVSRSPGRRSRPWVHHLMFLYDDDYRVMFDVREDSLLEGEKVKRLVENLGERVEAWSADEWDEVDWGAEALDSEALDPEALDPEQADDADLVIAVYSKHDGEVVDVRSFKDLSVVP